MVGGGISAGQVALRLIGEGHQVTALYELTLAERRPRGDVAIVRIRNKPPGPDASAVEWETRFPAEWVHYEFADTSEAFRMAFGAAAFAERLRASGYETLDYPALERLIGGAAGEHEEHGQLLAMVEAAARLDR